MSDGLQYGFLIGAARSGTKFVRDTLGVSDAVAAIPYDVNLFWRRGNERHPHDEFGEAEARPEVADDLHRLFREKARRLKPGASLLLEKTVSNSLRLPFVHRLFPEARFVFLVRDGKAVVESSSRVWDEPSPLSYKVRKLLFTGMNDWSYLAWYARDRLRNGAGGKGRHVWGPRYEGVEDDLATLSVAEVCAKQWALCNEAMLRDVGLIAPERCFQIRYEDLLGDGTKMEALCAFLGLPDTGRVMERFGATLQRGLDRKWETAFDADQRRSLGALMNETLRKLGYEAL